MDAWALNTDTVTCCGGTGLPFSLPRVCLGVEALLRVEEKPKRERPSLWEIKGKDKAASQLANCKASMLVLSSCQEFCALKRAKRPGEPHCT